MSDKKVNEKELTTEQLRIAYEAMLPHLTSIIERDSDYDFFLRVCNELHNRGALVTK